MILMKQHIEVRKVKSSKKKKDKNEASRKNPNIQMKKMEECENFMLKKQANYGWLKKTAWIGEALTDWGEEQESCRDSAFV